MDIIISKQCKFHTSFIQMNSNNVQNLPQKQQYYNMLILTEVKKRVQFINTYILSLQQKVNNKQYPQTVTQYKKNRQRINNSYMTQYDPNQFIIGSLKSRNEGLKIQKEKVGMRIIEILLNINRIKQKRGYYSHHSYTTEPIQFIQKISTGDVGAFASRITLKLSNADRIDYETVRLQTDFLVLKIVLVETVTKIPIRSIISLGGQKNYILICWRAQKTKNHSYMILKFLSLNERIMWSRCLNFAKLICESQLKKKLFEKEEDHGQISQLDEDNERLDKQYDHLQLPYKHLNLNLNNNKSYAYDRLKRKSQYMPRESVFNSIYQQKTRKISQDYNLKDSLNKLSNNPKKIDKNNSIKSFDEYLQLSHQFISKKQSNKKQHDKITNIEKQQQQLQKQVHCLPSEKILNEQQQLTIQQIKNTEQSVQSNKQIFFNESSIHWVEQQQQQNYYAKSSSENNGSYLRNQIDYNTNNNTSNSNSNNNNSNNNNNNNGKIINLISLSKDNLSKNQHISEVLDEAEESPLLPCNMREMKNKLKTSGFLPEIKLIRMSEKKGEEEKSNYRTTDVNQTSINCKDDSNGLKLEKIGIGESHEVDEEEYDESIHEEENYSSNKENISSSDDKQKDGKDKTLQEEQDSKYLKSERDEQETESHKYSLENLRVGIILEKCSSNGWSSHLKKLFLSNNDEEICWKNEKGTQLKKINIFDIEKIDCGIITPGISKHIKNIQKNRCMTIKCKKNNENKMLEFYLPENQVVDNLEQFYQKLNTYVRYKNTEEN